MFQILHGTHNIKWFVHLKFKFWDYLGNLLKGVTLEDERQGNLGKRHGARSRRVGTKCVDLCVSRNAQQRASPEEETVNKQMGRMTWSGSVSQISPPPPQGDIVGPWMERLWCWYGYYAWSQQHRLPLTKTDSATATDESPACQQQGPTMSMWCTTALWQDLP